MVIFVGISTFLKEFWFSYLDDDNNNHIDSDDDDDIFFLFS